jgi:hypothetical protein
MPKNKKGQYIAKKGKPSGPGHEKAGLKEVDHHKIDTLNKVEDEYMDGPDKPSDAVKELHPNRNLNKTDINKPPYS